MYINISVSETKGLHLGDLELLSLIRQQKSADKKITDYLSENLTPDTHTRFEEQGWVEYVKEKSKKDTLISRIRLSKKGQTVLDDSETPEVNSDDLEIYNWLETAYRSSDREIGNARKTKMYIALFRVNSGIERNCLAYLCKSFMDNEECFEWSRKLEFLFFKPANLYSVKFDINQSKLYQYYLNNKEMFDKKFENI